MPKQHYHSIAMYIVQNNTKLFHLQYTKTDIQRYCFSEFYLSSEDFTTRGSNKEKGKPQVISVIKSFPVNQMYDLQKLVAFSVNNRFAWVLEQQYFQNICFVLLVITCTSVMKFCISVLSNHF